MALVRNSSSYRDREGGNVTAVGGGEVLNWLILAPEDMLKMMAGSGRGLFGHVAGLDVH